MTVTPSTRVLQPLLARGGRRLGGDLRTSLHAFAQPSVLISVRFLLGTVPKDSLLRTATEAEDERIEPRPVPLPLLTLSDDPHAVSMPLDRRTCRRARGPGAYICRRSAFGPQWRQGSPIRAGGRFMRPRVLVVEDDPIAARALERLLAPALSVVHVRSRAKPPRDAAGRAVRGVRTERAAAALAARSGARSEVVMFARGLVSPAQARILEDRARTMRFSPTRSRGVALAKALRLEGWVCVREAARHRQPHHFAFTKVRLMVRSMAATTSRAGPAPRRARGHRRS
jgi:hypothetical protein